MAKHHQQNENTYKGKAKDKRVTKNNSTPNQFGVFEQVEPPGLGLGGTIQAQAARLGDSRLQTVQRQKMATQIGRRQGNGHLKRVISGLKQDVQQPHSATPQSKLTANQPNDATEREAEIVADRVMAGEPVQISQAATTQVQGGWLSDLGNLVGDALNIRENEAALDLWEDYKDADKALKAFKSKPHTANNFQSTTRLGMFDATYKPAKGILEVVCKCQFNFINATATEFPKAKPEELTWSDEKEMNNWKSKFLSTVSKAWSIERPIFYCQKDWWESLTAKVVSKFEAVDSDPHFVLNISKVPKKAKSPRSKVKRPKVKDDGSYTPGIGTFDEKDLKLTNKKGGKQIPAIHEAGHMLGLDDEYITGKEKVDKRDPRHAHLVKSEFGHGVARGADGRIMSGGSNIQPEHTVTFLAALKKATGMDEWTATKCPVPKPIPPNPHLQGAGDYPLPSSDTRPA